MTELIGAVYILLKCLYYGMVANLRYSNKKEDLGKGSTFPYLFILCIKVLGQQIHGVVEDGCWKAAKIRKERPQVSHIFFANDLILVGEGIECQANVMQHILQ